MDIFRTPGRLEATASIALLLAASLLSALITWELSAGVKTFVKSVSENFFAMVSNDEKSRGCSLINVSRDSNVATRALKVMTPT